MEIVNLKLEEIKPYEKNPRFNEKAVEKVSKSIQEFGFKVPIIVDKNNVIITGHTRYKAAQRLELSEVPCIISTDLTKEQVKAFRIADNKVAEDSKWDYDVLNEELADLDLFTGFDLNELEIDWATVQDLHEDTYKQPVKKMLRCPHCHHVDSTTHFKVVTSENIVELDDEDIS